jgi:hypothetical protein
MIGSCEVVLEAATLRDAAVLSNLLELYSHDLGDVFALEPGAARWTIRVSEGNQKGLRFWANVIAEYTSGAAVETTRSGRPHAWRVFSFNSAKPPR